MQFRGHSAKPFVQSNSVFSGFCVLLSFLFLAIFFYILYLVMISVSLSPDACLFSGLNLLPCVFGTVCPVYSVNIPVNKPLCMHMHPASSCLADNKYIYFRIVRRTIYTRNVMFKKVLLAHVLNKHILCK